MFCQSRFFVPAHSLAGFYTQESRAGMLEGGGYKRAGGILDEKNKHYLKVITDSTIRMGKLIDDLLAFSRMGRAEMMKKKTNLNSLVGEILKEF